MSDTTSDPARSAHPSDDAARAAPLEPSRTETDPPAIDPTAPPPGAEPTPPEDDKLAEAKPPTPDPRGDPRGDPRDRAIRQLAFEQRETRRQLQAAREALERAQPPRDPNAPLSQAETDALVEQRAQALLEQREAQARSEAWIGKGNAEYTEAVFNARCNALADMGAGENVAFMQAIGKLDDGHKVIVELADDPAEATRILKLPPIDLTLALAGISQRIAAAPPPAPKPTSQAPPPIRPLATPATTRGEPSLENLDGDAFRAAWNKRTRG